MGRRRRRYAVGQEPWILRVYGGVPVWLLIASGVFLVAVAAFALMRLD